MKFASEWIGDGVCDRDSCGQCSGFTTNGVFDGGDCGTAEKAVGTGCDASCMKFAAEWIGDGVCDRDSCGQCSGFTTNGVFDGGDCGTAAHTQEAEALAYKSEVHSASPLSLVNIFAAVGFAFTAYGAFRHYVK